MGIFAQTKTFTLMKKSISLMLSCLTLGLATLPAPCLAQVAQGRVAGNGVVRNCGLLGIMPLQQARPCGGIEKLPARADAGENKEIVIIDEDFSKFTAGSEDAPDPDYLGVGGEPYIDESLTQLPGWSCNYASQAGGTCALSSPIGGMLNTPVGDYSGEVTVTFRMKALSTEANVGVMIGSGGIWQPSVLMMDMARISSDETPGEGELDENGWKRFSFTFVNTYANDDCFIQFAAYYCQVLLDDIKVVARMSDFIAAPTALPATDFKADGFTAHWSEVRFADKYLFSLYNENVVGPGLETTNDFDGGLDLPDGWTADGVDETTADGGYGGSRAVVISRNATVTTPLYSERLKSADIWMRNVGGESYYAQVQVQGFDGSNWADLGLLFIGGVADDGEGSHLMISGENKPDFHDKYYQLRYVFSGWDSDAELGMAPKLAIDHIQIVTMPQTERVDVISDEENTGRERVVSGLDPYTDYYYTVTSVGGGKSAKSSPMLAFGISRPVTELPAGVSGSGYTARWAATPKATEYSVRDFGVFAAPDDEKGHAVLHETFSNATEGGREDPVMLDNSFTPSSLDSYTDYPGWTGASTIIAGGMVGCGGQGFNYIETPEMTLDNGDGSFTLRIEVDALYGDDGILVTPTAAQCAYSGFEIAEGDNVVELYFSGGSHNEKIRFSSQNGYPFYIKEVTVTQDISKGDKVYTYLDEATVGADCLEHTFDDVDFGQYPTHAYDVTAVYTRDYRQCTSVPSERQEVTSGPTGIGQVVAEAESVGIRSVDGGVIVSSEAGTFVDIYNVSGMKLAAVRCGAGDTFVPLGKGVYVVSQAGRVTKVAISR